MITSSSNDIINDMIVQYEKKPKTTSEWIIGFSCVTLILS